MPSDIEDMYAHMLSNIEGVYRQDAALLLEMRLAELSTSLLNSALALHNVSEQTPHLSIERAISLCKLSKRRISSICAGLLEVDREEKSPDVGANQRARGRYCLRSVPYADLTELATVTFYDQDVSVEFLHRTVYDFLSASKRGKQFLDENSRSNICHYASYIRAQLAKARLLGFYKPSWDGVSEDENAHEYVSDIMHILSLAEQRGKSAQMSLCDEVDRTLAAVYQRDTISAPKSHWAVRWGSRAAKVVTREVFVHSNPSSTASFHSVSSEVTVSHELNMQTSRLLDFLGVAASYGLFRYVPTILDSQGKLLHQDTADYLLCCSIIALLEYDETLGWRTEIYSLDMLAEKFELVTELLRRSGDPNTYVDGFSNTIWRES